MKDTTVSFIMLASAVIIPAVGVAYYFLEEESKMVLGLSVLSFLVVAFGAYVYSGRLDDLAGANTISDEEKAQLRTVSVARTSGGMIAIATAVAFFGLVVAYHFFDPGIAAVAGISLFVLILLAMIVQLSRPKYRIAP